jgi:transcriptional regulator with XRE-family HTH domain
MKKEHTLRLALAENIRELMHSRKMTVSALSRKSGVARNFINNLLAAKSAATVDTLEKLADALTVSPSRLIYDPLAHVALIEALDHIKLLSREELVALGFDQEHCK